MVANYVVLGDAADNLASLEGVRGLANLLGLNISTAVVVELHDADLEPALLRLINARGLSFFTHYPAPVDPVVLEKAREDLASSGMWIDHVNCRSAFDVTIPESDHIGTRINPDGSVRVEDIPENAYGDGESASVTEAESAKSVSVTTSELPAWWPPHSEGGKVCKICGQPVTGRKKICDRTECQKAQQREYQERWMAKKGTPKAAIKPQKRAAQIPYRIESGKHAGNCLSVEDLENNIKAGRYEVGTRVTKILGRNQGEYQVIRRNGELHLTRVEVE